MTDMQAFTATLFLANIAFINIVIWKMASKFDQMKEELEQFREKVGV